MTNITCPCLGKYTVYKNGEYFTFVCTNHDCRFNRIIFTYPDVINIGNPGDVYLLRIEAKVLTSSKFIELPISYAAKFVKDKNIDVAFLRVKYYNKQTDKIFFGHVFGWSLTRVLDKGVF